MIIEEQRKELEKNIFDMSFSGLEPVLTRAKLDGFNLGVEMARKEVLLMIKQHFETTKQSLEGKKDE